MYTKLATIASLAMLALIPSTLALPTENTLAARDPCTFTAYTGYNCDGEAGDPDVVTSNR